jgi:predicted amidohydrolase YtcJ
LLVLAAAGILAAARADTVIDNANGYTLDLFTMPTYEIHRTGVLQTWVAGRPVLPEELNQGRAAEII